MKRILNKGRRRLGIPGRPAILLGPGETSRELTLKEFGQIVQNRTVERWIEYGVLVVLDGPNKVEKKPKTIRPDRPKLVPARKKPPGQDERKPEPLPEGITGEGPETVHLGGGWWAVFVNGIKVTDTNVRKDEAERIASEYK